jgi:glycolate oxidase FAD binding subunit
VTVERAPEIIVPRNEAEVADAVTGAMEKGTAFEIVSRGSKRNFGKPVAAGTILDAGALSGILKYEPEELVVSARAATRLAEIEAALAERRQMLGFAPADWSALFGGYPGGATLAGTVATNACGARRVKAGAVRDHIIGCRFVNGSGEAIKAGGNVIKNVTGFDIPKLMCGAFGTLGVLTELTFRVVPKPARSATLALRNCAAESGLRALRQAAGLPIEPTGLSYLPAQALAASPAARAAQLGTDIGIALIRVEGGTEVLNEKLAILRRTFAAFDSVGVEDDAALFREIGEGGIFVDQANDIWRLCVASSDAYAAVEAGKAPLWYADWAGGLLWLGLPADEETARRLRGVTAQFGGHATLMRASAEARARLAVFEPEAPARATLTAAVKAAFDPQRLLNPGRMVEEL